MKRLVVALILLGVFGLTSTVMAANTATQTVTFQVAAINEIAVSGNPGALIINTATAGSEPASVTDATTSYRFTTNQNNKKITGAINSNMPANTTLEINLTAATGWSSAGYQSLSTSAVDLATGGRRAASGLTITYRFSATVDAGELSDSRTVTLTLTNQ